jgi:hypothetical protein
MNSSTLPSAEQTLECFRLCQQLTQMYLPIYLVRLDERTEDIVILAGEDVEIAIDRTGASKIL